MNKFSEKLSKDKDVQSSRIKVRSWEPTNSFIELNKTIKAQQSFQLTGHG